MKNLYYSRSCAGVIARPLLWLRCPSLFAAAFLIVAIAHAQVSFMGLGAGNRFAYSVSDDGSVVVGGGVPGISFRWTQGTGAVALGIPSGFPYSSAASVSGDGAVITGTMFNNSTGQRAYRWTSATGVVDLGLLGGYTNAAAAAISRDGSTIVGDLSGPPFWTPRAMKWTQASGIVALPTLGGTNGMAIAVSADGSKIFGGATAPDGSSHAVVWTDAGIASLAPISDPESTAEGTNSDGTIVVGGVDGAGTQLPFIWTEATGMVQLDLGTFTTGYATGVSDDGSFVIGSSNFDGLVWTAASGTRGLLDVLQNDYGIANEVAGWGNLLPTDITPDGRFIVGWGIFGSEVQGWILDRGLNPPEISPTGPGVSPVPEPSSMGALAGLGIVAFVGVRIYQRGRGRERPIMRMLPC
jgi:probable HAF family extracellular repeat protein